MKPKDLKSPFKWEERHVLLQDRILFVPNYYSNYKEFTFPSWDDEQIFGNTNPIHLEYCSGNGQWICDKALHNPGINWVAVEKRFDRCKKIWSKINNYSLNNLFIVCGEGLTATQYYFPSNSIESIYVNFPDPWPKDRHAKHRIVNSSFIEQCYRLLNKKGELNLVTDDPTYREQMISVTLDSQKFCSEYKPPYFTTENHEYGESWFCSLWEGKKRTIHYMKFIKNI